MKTVIMFVTLVWLFPGLNKVAAQQYIRGQVLDMYDNQSLPGVTVFIPGTSEGGKTDFEGNFFIKTTHSFPIRVAFAFEQYDTTYLDILNEAHVTLLLQRAKELPGIEIVGKYGAVEDLKPPQTRVQYNIAKIEGNPAPDLYSGLGMEKDIDVNVGSMGMKTINTRGFNSVAPIRMLQVIDGIDNQSPGLNFSLGNFLGASDLDLLNVEVIVGASGPYYGPNAFNGVISMETKNPFFHKGFTAMTKVGERNLFEAGIRYADVLKNRKGLESIAYKINLYALTANDWTADNYQPISSSKVPANNPGRFDAVNIYGDEYNVISDLARDSNNMISAPGLGNYYRRGYREVDLVDYSTHNYKGSVLFHLRTQPEKIHNSPELIAGTSFGAGSAIYQGDNRFSLRNISMFQHRVEYRLHNTFFLRAYLTHENAGKSYDPYFTALRLQDLSHSDRNWNDKYDGFWREFIMPRMYALNYPKLIPAIPPALATFDKEAANAWMITHQDSLIKWHEWTSAYSDTSDEHNLPGAQDFFEPGTERFQNAFKDITSRLNSEGGTRFYDHSALINVHGEYVLHPKYFSDITAGASFRQYLPDSKGTIFHDTSGTRIRNSEFGLYAGMKKKFFVLHPLYVTTTLRVDKNQNFKWLPTYAASALYQPGEETYLRLSLSSALRNPTLSDQYLYLNVGPAILAGHTAEVDSLITPQSFEDVYRGFPDLGRLKYFSLEALRPEFVRTLELGVQTTIWKRCHVDASAYVNQYRDFIGYVIGIKSRFESAHPYLPINPIVFRYSTNSKSDVITHGWSIGVDFAYNENIIFRGNYSYNSLRKTNENDPIIPAYNTPKHKFNIGLAGKDLKIIRIGSFTKSGFNVNYKWVDGFQFEGSPQFTGQVRSYGVVDAQINISSDKFHTQVKVGCANLLGQQYAATYGGPTIGRQAYVQVRYDLHR